MKLVVLLQTPRSLGSIVSEAVEAGFAGVPPQVRKKMVGLRKPPYQIEVSVVGRSKSRTLNQRYRKKNRPTDVLSFSLMEGVFFPGSPLLGSLVICGPVAKAQAKEYGESLAEEYQRLVVHGVLHLFGYDHERSRAEEKRMFSLQDKILDRLAKRGSPRPDQAGRRGARAKASKRKSRSSR